MPAFRAGRSVDAVAGHRHDREFDESAEKETDVDE